MRRIQLTIVLTVLTLVAAMGAATAAGPTNFRAHLSGDQEVPPADTDAQGQVTLKVAPDGQSASYRLIVANIEDVNMAHLHLAPVGENGGIVVWLYPDAPPPQPIPGRTDGVLATGTITADNLVGELAGDPFSALVEAIEAGHIYANVHTAAFPGGEVRGQLH